MAEHQFEASNNKRICSECLRSESETSRSSRPCPGVPWYRAGQAPNHLYTNQQLAKRGLRPGAEHAGIVVTAHHDVVNLYDIAQAQPRRCDTEARKIARAATWAKTAEKWRCEHCGQKPNNIGELTNWWIMPGLCEECRDMLKWQNQQARLEARFERDRKAACKWAYELMQRQDWCLVDTETSGLYGVVLEIAAIAPDGRELFHSLIHPDGAHVEAKARAVHGISDQELEHAPRLPEIWTMIQTALAHCTTLVAYNVAFDQARIEQSARRYSLPKLAQEWQCAMDAYAEYCGDWSDYHGSYRWQKLPGAGHRALDDARAALYVIKRMAAVYSKTQKSEQQEKRGQDA